MKNRIKNAYWLFRAQDFRAALKLYESLRHDYKTKIFDANIFLCRKNLTPGINHSSNNNHKRTIATQINSQEKREREHQERVNVGVLLSSRLNLKYLNKSHLVGSATYRVSLFYMHDNGIQPLHDFSFLAENYSYRFDKGSLGENIISVDVLLEALPDTILTIESIQAAADAILFSGKPPSREFRNWDIDASKVVDARVSVILPTYKRPSQLEKAIRSVLSQDYRDVELIVVDDNGRQSEFSNATKKIIDKVLAEYSSARLKHIQHNCNANGAAARNTGILHSTGGYICFLDDDDIYLQGRISRSVETLEYTDEDVGGCYCGFLGWNSANCDPNRFVVRNLTKELLALDYGCHYLHTNTVTYKRSAVFWLNGFDTSYRRHQDVEFNLRFFQSYKTDVVEECLAQINPEKSVVDNKIYGIDIFNLKRKFLMDFESIINDFDEETRKRIYIKNWEEAVYYARDTDNLLDSLKNDYSNGAIQVVSMIEARNSAVTAK